MPAPRPSKAGSSPGQARGRLSPCVPFSRKLPGRHGQHRGRPITGPSLIVRVFLNHKANRSPSSLSLMGHLSSLNQAQTTEQGLSCRDALSLVHSVQPSFLQEVLHSGGGAWQGEGPTGEGPSSAAGRERGAGAKSGHHIPRRMLFLPDEEVWPQACSRPRSCPRWGLRALSAARGACLYSGQMARLPGRRPCMVRT